MNGASTQSTLRPMYFGPQDRPRFAQLHLPMQQSVKMGAIICAPLGYEGQFAQLGLLDLAANVANRHAAAVMSIDYDGCGDSVGTDEDPDRVVAWLASINDAVDELKKHLHAGAPIVLIGLRAGALLAASVASEREDIAAVVLWAPCVSGRTFLREQRAFASMAYVTATPGVQKESAWGDTWGEKGFEANGYVFTDETAVAFETIDFKKFTRAPAKNILVLQRAELPAVKIPEAWRTSENNYTENYTEIATSDYERMMQPPWMSAHATESVNKIIEWLSTLPVIANAPTNNYSASDHTAKMQAARITPNAIETPLWYDETHERLAILTEPLRSTEPGQSNATQAVILITSTFGYRIGPNRMNVAAAREFANSGIATLRIDLRDTNAREIYSGAIPKGPYNLNAVNDVLLAVDYLRRRGYKKITLVGICAGAFLAWRAALATQDIASAILINPRTLVPIPYDLNDHIRFTQGSVSWRVVIRRERNPLRLLIAMWPYGLRALHISWQMITARVPLSIARSTLGGKIFRLGRAGTHTRFVFSEGDDGIKDFVRELGANRARLTRRGYLSATYIDGPDHSFTPRWANSTLIAELAKILTDNKSPS